MINNLYIKITFFCALLSIAAEWEAAGLHCIWLRPTIPEDDIDSTSFLKRVLWLGSRADPNPQNIEKNLKDTGAKAFYQEW